MEITKIKFMSKRTQIKYFGSATNPASDDLTEVGIKSPNVPHPDFLSACKALIPHLQVAGDLKNGNYQVLEINISQNDETESITVKLQKNLEGGKVVKIELPAIEIQDKIVAIVEAITEEAILYATNKKQSQGTFDFEGEHESEVEPEAAEAA